MAAPRSGGGWALVRLRLSGLVFLVVIGLLLALSVALYNKTFTKVVTVTLQADRAGNQLSAPTDVKLRGLIVGEVRKVSSSGDGADLELALDPGKSSLIPSNVQARLLPKTLFGEKYVALVIPEAPSPQPIQAGAVIGQDRSETSIETSRVLDDLLPLLKALKPDDLSRTLNALSGALRGRGNEIGANAVLVRDYLKQLNPALPTIQQDIIGLADEADTLDEAAPDLLAVLDDLSFSSRSLQDQESEFTRFLTTGTTFSGSLDSLLRQNEQRLIRLASESLPSLQLYARYSPEFGCFLQGLDKYNRVVGATFGGDQPGLHIRLEVTRDSGGYVKGDEPQYLDDSPPACRGLPVPKVPPNAPDEEFKDGYRDAEQAQAAGGSGAADGSGVSAQSVATPVPLADSPAGQVRVLNGLAAPMLGVPVNEVPDLAQLLFGPMARGTTVTLS